MCGNELQQVPQYAQFLGKAEGVRKNACPLIEEFSRCIKNFLDKMNFFAVLIISQT